MKTNPHSTTRSLVLAALFLALAFVLPIITGHVPQVGNMLCPMHFPILLCGFVLGGPWGLAVGFIAPLVRSVLFGMPPMFPIAIAMAFELAAYGLVSGVLWRKVKHTVPMMYASLVTAMVAGRLVWGAVRFVLAGLTGYELTRGVLCAMRRPAPLDFRELCAGARRVAVLENVVDSTNVGAIIRSAAALGMDAVLLTPSCCDPLNRRAVRVSMGTVFQIPWAYLGSAPSEWPHPGLEQLQAMGFKTVAMALRDDSVSIDDEKLAAEPKLAIVLGTEGTGLMAHTIADCDYTVRIPMQHGVDSLNVAAASAVAFWQLRAK